MNIWVIVYRITWVLIALVLLGVVVVLFIPKYAKYKDMQRQQAVRQEEKQLLELKASRLQLKQERFTTEPGFVERTARGEGMVKSNETICKMTDTP